MYVGSACPRVEQNKILSNVSFPNVSLPLTVLCCCCFCFCYFYYCVAKKSFKAPPLEALAIHTQGCRQTLAKQSSSVQWSNNTCSCTHTMYVYTNIPNIYKYICNIIHTFKYVCKWFKASHWGRNTHSYNVKANNTQ